MDRMYKAEDTVKVYETTRDGELLATFKQAPYTYCGFDNYKYKGVLYKGYVKDGQAYILLSNPVL